MRQVVLLFSLIFFFQLSKAQETIKMSLKEALDYAVQHHPELQKGKIDVEIAEQRVKETAAIGLPQVNGSFGFQQNIELPVFIFPNPATGEQTAFRVGQEFSNTLTLQASQLIFDGTYFLGLKAASKYVDISKKLQDVSERDVKLNVMNAYHMVLISRESLRLIETNIETIEESARQTKVLYEQGFAEKLDADRVQLALFNLNTQKSNLKEQLNSAERLLYFQLGLPFDQNLVLTDSLQGLFNNMNRDLVSQDAQHTQREEYQLLKAQQTLNELDRKRYLVNRLPSLSAFYSYQQNNFSDELNFDPWFRTQLWGVNLSIPIFSGGVNQAILQQKELSMKKTEEDMRQFLMLSEMEYENARGRIRSSISEVDLQKSNLQLAQSVLEAANAKFQQGTGSILDVLNAQQELRSANTNYLNAIYNFLSAYSELQKSLGNL